MNTLYTIEKNKTPGTFVTVTGNGLRVNLVYIGEGYYGDFNPNTPDDEPLLRFDVCKLQSDGSWKHLNDGSACTLLSKNDHIDILVQAAIFIWTSFYAVLNYAPANGDNAKHICERCSFLSATDFPTNI